LALICQAMIMTGAAINFLNRGSKLRRSSWLGGAKGVAEQQYGSASNQLFTEYIWLLPEAGDGDRSLSWPSPAASSSSYGGDDGSGGWMPLAVCTFSSTGATSRRSSVASIYELRVDLRVGVHSLQIYYRNRLLKSAIRIPPSPPFPDIAKARRS
jgi:hypothetical protein